MFSPITYLREVSREIQKVSWPSREHTQQMTLLVLGVSVIVGLYIGLLDFLFQQLMTAIL